MTGSSAAARWIGVAGAALFLYFALDATLSVRNVEKLREESAAVAHTHAVVTAIEKVMSDLKDAETGQRGFVITGNEDYLEPYRQAATRVEPDLQSVAGLVEDSLQRASQPVPIW